MNTTNWRRFAYKVVYFIQMQTFLTLIFFPIVIAWGLPISLCAPLCNILFGPILTLFLFLSSLIFFSEILYIPNDWLIWTLEHVSNMWLWILSLEIKFFSIGFVKPSYWILVSITVFAFIIMQIRSKNWTIISTIMLVIFLLCTGIILKFNERKSSTVIHIARTQPAPTFTQATEKSCTDICCVYAQKKVIIIDPGLIGRSRSASSWVSYTLMPEIIKSTGRLTIDHLILLQVNSILFDALTTLCTKMTIKKVYLPYWSGKMSGGAWRAFYEFRDALKKTGGTLIRMNGDVQEYVIDGELSLTLKSLGQQLGYQKVKYPAFCVCGDVAEQKMLIHPIKYRFSAKK